jgi:acetyl-CoA acetyltransferase
MDAVSIAARAIKAGEADLMIAGGVESMSRAPFVMPKATSAFSRANAVYDTTIGWRFVNPKLKAAIRHGFDAGDRARTSPTSSTSAAKTRTPSPCAARTSAAAAQAAGRFDAEIVPVTIPQRKGDPVVVDKGRASARHHASRSWPA